MNKIKVGYLILVAIILLIAGAVIGWLDLSGRLPWQSGNLYEDPEGGFTMKLNPNWEQDETGGSYTEFKMPDPAMHLYVQVLKTSTISDSFSRALQTVGFDQGLLSSGGTGNPR